MSEESSRRLLDVVMADPELRAMFEEGKRRLLTEGGVPDAPEEFIRRLEELGARKEA